VSLPEKIKVYLIRLPNGTIADVTHDGTRAVRIKEEWRVAGIFADIESRVSTRNPHAEGQIAVRCYPCPSHHLISVEAVDGPSELYDGCCDAASRRRLVDALLTDRQFAIEMCDHEFEDTGKVEHEVDEQPVSMNPFTDVITYRTYMTDIADQKCVKCGLTQVEVRACTCEPAERCRCPGDCRC
jgi:hypothetical protein